MPAPAAAAVPAGIKWLMGLLAASYMANKGVKGWVQTPKESAGYRKEKEMAREARRRDAMLVASENRERGRQRIEGRAARREQTSLQEAAMSHQSNMAMLTGLASLFGGGSQEIYGQMGAAGRPGFSPVDARVQNDMAMLARMGAV